MPTPSAWTLFTGAAPEQTHRHRVGTTIDRKSEPEPNDLANVGFSGLSATANAPVVAFCAIDVVAAAHDPSDFFTFNGFSETSFVSDPSAFRKTVSFGP